MLFNFFIGEPEASFTKDEMQQGKHQEYEKKLYEQYNVVLRYDFIAIKLFDKLLIDICLSKNKVGDQKILHQFKIHLVIMVPLKICHKIIKNLGLLSIMVLHTIIHQVKFSLFYC